jgi:hypothetical protein
MKTTKELQSTKKQKWIYLYLFRKETDKVTGLFKQTNLGIAYRTTK